MGLIKKSSIDALREKVDIVSVIGNYVTLRRSGAYWKGLSPFSNEKTPSFFVSPERGIFKCFSSGLGGDVFRFVQLKEQMNFAEAAEFLAEQYHFLLEYEGSGAKSDDSISKSALIAVHEQAAKYFAEFLFSSHFSAHRAREYWINARKFSLATAEKYAIGLAPVDGREFRDLMGRAFSEKILVASGLFLRSDQSNDLISRFRGRLMIPIRDTNGKVIAFSGRLLPNVNGDKANEAKYINSPETPLFHKGHVLFGLDRARKKVDDRTPFVLVEGQLDCIRCWECSIETAVAPEGTAITEEQLLLIRRHCPTAYSLLDGDVAGRRAALRLIPMAIKCGLDLRMISLPTSEDPDSFLLNHGSDGWQNLLRQSQSFVSFLEENYLSNFQRLSPVQKKSGLEKIYGNLALLDSKVAEFEALNELALQLKADGAALKNDYVKFCARNGKETGSKVAGTRKIVDAWEELLTLLLNHDPIVVHLEPLIDPQWIDDHSSPSRILNGLIAEIQNGESMADAIQKLSDVDQDYVAGLMIAPTKVDNLNEKINQILAKIHGAFLKREIAKLDGEISKNSAPAKELIAKRMEWKRQLSNPPTIPTELI